MSSKFFKIIFATVLSSCLLSQAHANLIVGENYTDSDNVLWEYVGNYDMVDGPLWTGSDLNDPSDNATPFNGLEAAIAAGVTNSALADLAIAAFSINFDFGSVTAGDQIVNHMAWYDGAGTAITMFDEDIIADGNGDGLYTQGIFTNGETDRSAWVDDRVFFSGEYVNYVFKRVSVSEPATLAIMALVLCGLGARRLKS